MDVVSARSVAKCRDPHLVEALTNSLGSQRADPCQLILRQYIQSVEEGPCCPDSSDPDGVWVARINSIDDREGKA